MDERVNIVVDAFRKTVKDTDVKIFLLIVILFFITGLILFYVDKIKDFLSKRYLKKLFFVYAEDVGLTKEETEILWRYANKLKRDPFLVLEFKAPFEKVIDLYIKENPDFDEGVIRRIRRKLGFDKIPPFVPLVSTKDIDIYQTGNLISEGRKIYPVALYEKDELYMYWWLIDRKPPFDFDRGSKVRIRFIRKDDAIYAFEGIVEDIFEEDGKYIVKIPHTFKLEAINRREEFRVREKLPLLIETETIEGKKVKIGTETTDISIDGLSFCIPILEVRDKKLGIQKEIDIMLRIEDKEVHTKAVIKNVRESGHNMCFGVRFEEISKEDREVIKQFINKKQKELIKKYRGKYVE